MGDNMKGNNIIKRTVRCIAGELILLFAPGTLSTLHLASCYGSSGSSSTSCSSSSHENSRTKQEKELLKLSKRMLKVATRLSENGSEKDNRTQNNVELFYDLYNKRDNLTLKELKLLRDFYDILRHNNCFAVTESCETIKCYEYSEAIDELIDEKRYMK